jgi:CBS domain-containing protein
MARSGKKPRKRALDLDQPVSRFAKRPIVIFADDAVRDAAKLMRDKATGSILVAENYRKKDEPIGILTEWDLLSRVVAAGRDAATTRVREVMSSPVRKIEADATVSDALKLMTKDGIRRLAVMEDGVLVGTITQTQLTARGRGFSIPIVEPIKGHACPYCSSNFGTRKKLSEHVALMHEETVYLEIEAKQ